MAVTRFTPPQLYLPPNLPAAGPATPYEIRQILEYLTSQRRELDALVSQLKLILADINVVLGP